jgi:hypothetical protein
MQSATFSCNCFSASPTSSQECGKAAFEAPMWCKLGATSSAQQTHVHVQTTHSWMQACTYAWQAYMAATHGSHAQHPCMAPMHASHPCYKQHDSMPATGIHCMPHLPHMCKCTHIICMHACAQWCQSTRMLVCMCLCPHVSTYYLCTYAHTSMHTYVRAYVTRAHATCMHACMICLDGCLDGWMDGWLHGMCLYVSMRVCLHMHICLCICLSACM